MLYLLGIDQVYHFGSIRSKVILIYCGASRHSMQARLPGTSPALGDPGQAGGQPAPMAPRPPGALVRARAGVVKTAANPGTLADSLLHPHPAGRAPCSLKPSSGGWPMPASVLADLPEYLTFDDVLLKPAASSVMPGEVDTRTRLTRDIELFMPIISAAMA